jgi:hypothetical protein
MCELGPIIFHEGNFSVDGSTKKNEVGASGLFGSKMTGALFGESNRSLPRQVDMEGWIFMSEIEKNERYVLFLFLVPMRSSGCTTPRINITHRYNNPHNMYIHTIRRPCDFTTSAPTRGGVNRPQKPKDKPRNNPSKPDWTNSDSPPGSGSNFHLAHTKNG